MKKGEGGLGSVVTRVDFVLCQGRMPFYERSVLFGTRLKSKGFLTQAEGKRRLVTTLPRQFQTEFALLFVKGGFEHAQYAFEISVLQQPFHGDVWRLEVSHHKGRDFGNWRKWYSS